MVKNRPQFMINKGFKANSRTLVLTYHNII